MFCSGVSELAMIVEPGGVVRGRVRDGVVSADAGIEFLEWATASHRGMRGSNGQSRNFKAQSTSNVEITK